MSGKKKSLRQSTITSFLQTGSSTPLRETERTSGSAKVKSPNENFPETDQKKNEAKGDGATPLKSVNKRRRVVISSDEEEDSDHSTSYAKDSHKKPKIVSSDSEENLAESSSMADVLTDECSRMSITSSDFNSVLVDLNEKDQKVATKVMHAANLINSLKPSIADFSEDVPDAVESPSVKVSKKGYIPRSITESDQERFPHLYDEDFRFLKPEHIKDFEGRKKSHPDYDPKTLFVPEAFMKKQTPGHKQWWTLKSQNFDTILFFKVGKFYEMYHMDAVVGVECLNLIYMRGKFAHAGFPEMAYGRYADQLVSRGYKVARIEQTETPQQLDERCKTSKVKEKVVKREVCRLTTQATRTYGVLDTSNEQNSLDFVDSSAKYFIAIAEKVKKSDSSNISTSEYGICISDTSTGTFILSQFTDDECHSFLRTLLAQHPPLQVVYEKGHSSSSTQAVLSSTVGHCQKEGLVPNAEFYGTARVLEILSGDDYFGCNVSQWPASIAGLLEDPSGGIPKSKPEYSMALSSFGATLWYFKRCLIDVDMVTMQNFTVYDPLGAPKQDISKCDTNYWKDKRMILDCAALINLNLVGPLDSRKKNTLRDPTAAKFSLYSTINKCSTPFGKRKLRVWVCSPLCDTELIAQRQDAIEFLCSMEAQTFVTESLTELRKIPDLERLLQKIHTLGLKYRVDKHPDGRAVLFDMTRYNKRKICDLANTLDGFRQVIRIRNRYLELQDDENLKQVTLLEKCFGDGFVDITRDLQHFSESFNQEQAVKEGIIVPRPGMDAEYDKTCEKVSQCMKNLDAYLKEQQKKLKCSAICYVAGGKSRYTLEIPEAICDSLRDEFELKSQRKGFRRYTTPRSEDLLNELIVAEEERDKIRLDLLRRVFADFDSRKIKWAATVQAVATFDCLLSLAQYVKTCGMTMTRPELVVNSDKVFLEVEAGYHPSLALLMSSSTKQAYIPNSTFMGGDHPLTILLTGPNMGGKSTLMRQVAVLVVLAQMGCFVPASKMRFTPVDRIFTRIGASDRIMAGQSTFFVELNEAKTILRDASPHSLVVIDELGRGTSTYDGAAIASSVLKFIARSLRCRCFFSTHYLALCSEVEAENNVLFAHMSCMVENENKDDPTLENVTFLYTVVPGICPKSYGFYAAKLAGIPPTVVRAAYDASKQYHVGVNNTTDSLRKLRSMAQGGGVAREKIVAAIDSLL
ncbi:hypothetical protein QR680_001834 [Steinernema hermaphroditum]|uniref:DNA mismatch repair protein n=1 Tax=Steinernema hermaphroditum TaxID=289476 RepID=A0AA39LH01_9BILA|nr:hypothetical protein QR680_001834 [Steinernema hermaphroditum]